MKSLAKFFIALALLLAVTNWYFRKQPQINVAGGKGWDGVVYHQMYQFYKGTASQEAYEAPFNKRVGLPWLAAQAPLDATRAFRFINIASGLAACLLVYLALRPRARSGVVFACMLPMAFYIYSPIRLPNFYPFTVDPPAIFLCALATFLISRKYYVAAGIALVSSTFFRESGVYFALVLGIALAVNNRRHRPAAALICLMAAAGAIIASLLHLPGSDYSQVRTVMSSLRHKMLDPLELLRTSACILMTLAPFLICKVRNSPEPRGEPDEAHSIGCWFLLLCLAMSVAGGSDTTRIFFIGYPLYVLVLAEWVSKVDVLTAVLVSVAGLVANRSREMIPKPIATWPNNDLSGLFSITPDYAHIGIGAAFLAYWFAWWFVISGPGRATLDDFARLCGRFIPLKPK